MQVLRITITIDVPDGGGTAAATVAAETPKAARPTPGSPTGPLAPDEPSASLHADGASGDDGAAVAAGVMLQDLGVEGIPRLLSTYAPERIINVCQSAEKQRQRLKNPAGWAKMALLRNWTV